MSGTAPNADALAAKLDRVTYLLVALLALELVDVLGGSLFALSGVALVVVMVGGFCLLLFLAVFRTFT
ncbi:MULTISPECIES: hypothetical protein [Halorussus]|uniref:hypothetical protein n=1 Tax=Halorussus TaxID=1070314 RepID=UPI0020A05C8E|nr:hypothetical protein [Halorussus vallis]USZ74409.1 hypothetical protein NGM07_13250 [Halorussus vallis]